MTTAVVVSAHAATPWSTPRRLRAFTAAIAALSLTLFFLGEATIARSRHGLDVIGNEAAPSIIAAQEISALLADLDANAANYLLGTTAQVQAAKQIYEERRMRVTQRMVDVAENITAGDQEKSGVLSLFESLGTYQELVAQSRMQKDRDDPKGALDTYLLATALMHRDVLPAAARVDLAKRTYLDDTYGAIEEANAGFETLAILNGIALIGVLVVAQIFLARKTRRILSPLLLGATATAVLLTTLLAVKFSDAREDLRVAKEDAFDSIHLLWKVRALAFDANGDESRYLLDTAHAGDHEKAFDDRIALLTPRPSEALKSFDELKGSSLFGRLLSNVTFAGEQKAVALMIRDYARYYAIDRKIRAKATSGKRDAAITLCIGTEDDGSNAALGAFDSALEKVLAINTSAFHRTIDAADAGLRNMQTFDPLLAMAIAALGFFGIRPRLKEYAA